MTRTLLLTLAAAAWAIPASAITIEPPFDADYTFLDLGSVPGLPTPSGGLTFVPGDPDTLLIGGSANNTNADVFSIGVVRDADDHVTGFAGMATFVADAPGITFGGIDGGLAFGPGGVLFYTSYSDNSLGQIMPGSTAPDLQIPLTPLGVSQSVGTVAFVPPGFSGAGRMKIAQYNAPGHWYDVVLGAPNSDGTYPIASVTLEATIGFGPEGIIYISDANPQFTAPSVLVSEYSGGSVSAYEIDAEGDPVPATRRVFMSQLTGAEGAVIDPLTGDFLFSTFGGGNRVIVVQGFVPPPSTTTTTTAPATTSTSTSTTTTTTTVPSDDCGLVPPGPTFASIRCRLTGLVDATGLAGGLGTLQAKVLVPLGKGEDRVVDAVARCQAGDLRRARTRLRQLGRQLIGYAHRLRSNTARKRAAEEVREPLAAEAAAIGADVKALRAALVCPDDAAGIP